MRAYLGARPCFGSWTGSGPQFEEKQQFVRSLIDDTALWVLTYERDSEKSDPFCRQKPEYCIGGSLNANYFSKKGVYNGTGIALAGESWNVGQRRIFTLYFQHNSGDIRFMQYTTDQKWIGGTKAETVATDAKNASPISAVAVGLNSTQYVRYSHRNSEILY
jgi:hypothetical protein